MFFHLTDYCYQLVGKFTLFVTLGFVFEFYSVLLFLPHNLIGFSIMLYF